ncbi:inositol-1-monophosphatase [Alkalibacterium psychrotolerans]
MDLSNVYNDMIKWTKGAGKLILDNLNNDYQVEYKKSKFDLVTYVDKKVEQYFIELITEKYPTHFILGEETSNLAESNFADKQTIWIIDPIDGTTSFIKQNQNFSISVALYHDNQLQIGVIYDPIKNEMFHCQKGHGAYINDKKIQESQSTPLESALIGINNEWFMNNNKVDYHKVHNLASKTLGTRIIGCAALEMAYVAIDRLQGFISFELSPWDCAAGIVILEEVGIEVVDKEFNNIDILQKEISIIAGSNQLVSEIKNIFN